jgi:hypothetical protein
MRSFFTQEYRQPGETPADVRLRLLSLMAFLTLSALIMSALGLGDRTYLLDQDNYVQYFRDTNIYWFTNLWDGSLTGTIFVIRMVTEELGWRAWVLALNTLGCSPEGGVRITVLALNALMIYLVLWAVIPDALATVGLFQIRQGFAFAIAMYFAFARKQPVRGAALASLVHTTFAYPAIFLIIARLCVKRSQLLNLLSVSAAATTMAVLSSLLFNIFGGRRLVEYDQQENYTLNYLIALVIFTLIPYLIVRTRDERTEDPVSASVTRQISTMYAGILVFLIVSFFVYPFGMARIGYYSTLMIPFLLPSIRVKNKLVLWLITGIVLVIGYDVFKKYSSGLYSYFL